MQKKFFIKSIFTIPAITLFFLFIFSTGSSAQNVATPERNAVSSIVTSQDKNGETLITTINRKYSVIDFPDAPLPAELLLLEEVKRKHQLGAEGSNSTVKVDAWFGINSSQKAWTIEQPGDEGHVQDEFYMVTKFAGGTMRQVNFYYNLETGQRVFTATDKLSVIGSRIFRYVAYHSSFGVIPPPELQQRPQEKDVVGFVQYATSKKALFKIAIHYRFVETIGHIKFMYKNKIIDNDSVDISQADEQKTPPSLSNFSIIISYGPNHDIILPVVNDKIDFKNAKTPVGFRLEIIE